MPLSLLLKQAWNWNVLRANNGGEYISNQFTDICAENGIKRELITLYNPTSNGVVERYNRVWCMLSIANPPHAFWGQALQTAVRILTIDPHTIHLKVEYWRRFVLANPTCMIICTILVVRLLCTLDRRWETSWMQNPSKASFWDTMQKERWVIEFGYHISKR